MHLIPRDTTIAVNKASHTPFPIAVITTRNAVSTVTFDMLRRAINLTIHFSPSGCKKHSNKWLRPVTKSPTAVLQYFKIRCGRDSD